VVTIEPGLYFRKGLNGVKFGVRFEDVLRVSSTKNEIFTAGFENFEDLVI
jgi:Xaa-Pro aminopeptidase